MYVYDEEADRARTWRPDLVPHIIRWLNSIPPPSLKYLEKIAVSDLGGFEATFCYRQKTVRFGFECPRRMVIFPEEGKGMWCAEKILPFEQRQLEVATSH